MEKKYFIGLRPQTDESHRIHKEGCPFMPDQGKRISLGSFGSPNEAFLKGKKYFGSSSRCQFCSPVSDEERSISFSTVDCSNKSIISSDAIIAVFESSLVCALN